MDDRAETVALPIKLHSNAHTELQIKLNQMLKNKIPWYNFHTDKTITTQETLLLST